MNMHMRHALTGVLAIIDEQVMRLGGQTGALRRTDSLSHFQQV